MIHLDNGNGRVQFSPTFGTASLFDFALPVIVSFPLTTRQYQVLSFTTCERIKFQVGYGIQQSSKNSCVDE